MRQSSTDDTRPPRSVGSITCRRVPNGWDASRDFKILSIDGGGMRGIFQAAFLGELEKYYLGNSPIGQYFDLIAGTSTGGIIAMGLGKGLSAQKISTFYEIQGRKIFPPTNFAGKILRYCSRFCKHSYKPEKLRLALLDLLGESNLADSKAMLCIPSSEREHTDVTVFKTPHHFDFKTDWQESMVTVGMATSTAPTYFNLSEDRGYKFLDGGLWANNPILVAAVEALTSFDVDPDQVKILSIGNSTGARPVSKGQLRFGGIWAFRHIVEEIMEFQSEGAIGQASLLVGADAITRIRPIQSSFNSKPIQLDDWRRATKELPAVAAFIADSRGEEIASRFLASKSMPFLQYYYN